MTILAGDLGGTKTVLALYRPEDPIDRPCRLEKFRSGEYDDLESIVERFLGEAGERPRAAAFGVAGPVVGGKAHITNLKWDVDPERLSASFGIASLGLLNDLQATALAIPHLAPEDRCTLSPGDSGAGRIDRGYRGGNRARHGVPGSRARRLPGVSDGGRTHVVRAARRRRGGVARVPPRTPRPRQLRASLLRHRSSQHLRLPA